MDSKKSKAAATSGAADLPAIGSVFTVTEIVEFEDGRRLIARYLPQFPDAEPDDPVPTYRVTEINQAFVAAQIAVGVVTLGGPAAPTNANALTSGTGKASGTVRP